MRLFTRAHLSLATTTAVTGLLASSLAMAQPPREGDRPPGDPANQRRDGDRPAPRESGDRGPGDRGPGDRGPGDRGPGDRGPGRGPGPGGFPNGGQGGFPPRGMMRMPIMAALDIDGNGEISADEIDLAVASLRKLDRNKDGKLTVEELMPEGMMGGGMMGGMMGGGMMGGPGGAAVDPAEMVSRMMQADVNGDGFIDKEEAPERLQPMFARADTDGDGKLSKDELMRGIARRNAEGGPRPEGGPRGEGAPRGEGGPRPESVPRAGGPQGEGRGGQGGDRPRRPTSE